MATLVSRQHAPRRWFVLLTGLLVVSLLALNAPLPPLHAQESRTVNSVNTVITVALPSFLSNRVTDQVIAAFEAQQPGYTLKVIDVDMAIPDPATDLQKHFEEIEKLVSSADVVLVDASRISPEATLAGYFLDLAPLVAEDGTLNPEDFFPAVWRAYQWDKGVWALPFSANAVVLTYDPNAFEDAGIAPPSEQWSLDDLITAAQALVQKDAEGKVTRAGLDFFSLEAAAALFRSLTTQPTFDASIVPHGPTFANAEVEALLSQWRKLEEDGVIKLDFNASPMSISPIFTLMMNVVSVSGDNTNSTPAQRKGILLPGGTAGLDVNAFAVSSGTTRPQQAYALAKFLTERPELGVSGLSIAPARRSLVGQTNEGGLQLNLTTEVQTLVDQALEVGTPLSEMRFFNYIAQAYRRMREGNANSIEALPALQEAEARAQQHQQQAIERRANVAITVPTVAPDSTTAADGRAILKFALTSFFVGDEVPGQAAWERLIADFTATDPEIGAVQMDRKFDDLNSLLRKHDCVYLPYNAIPNADLSAILPLDPFVDADPGFDKADVVGNTLAQLTRDGKLWAYPLVIEPAVLKYHAERFAQAGAAAPAQGGWTVADFNNALQALKTSPDDAPPFVDSGTGGTAWLILMAAYGGVPIDFRTDPPTIDFTSPASVDAIRQVLDLAKRGYLKYTKLANFLGGGLIIVNEVTGEAYPITTDTLNAFGFRFGAIESEVVGGQDPYRLATYPRGSTLTGASYNIGVGLISATSPHPDACYRFFNAISQAAGVLEAMPARRSRINDPVVVAEQGDDLTALYNEIDRVLSDPGTINFPAIFSGGASQTGFLIQHWLYQAFDQVVLDDADLGTVLADAEQKAKDFQACAATVPPLDNTDPTTQREYLKALGKCATSVDPSLEAFFSSIR